MQLLAPERLPSGRGTDAAGRKRQKCTAFARKAKPKVGEDRRHSGALPGRPRKVKETVEDVPALNWGELRQTGPALLWGDAAVYEKALEFEAAYYEQTGQLERSYELQEGAEQSSYRQRGLGGEKQSARDRQRALMQCSVAEHAANQQRISFSMMARSVTQLSRKSQSQNAWAENPTLTSNKTAYQIVEQMMKHRPEHTFMGEKDMLNGVFVYDQVFRSDGCNTKSGESRGLQRLNSNGQTINAGAARARGPHHVTPRPPMSLAHHRIGRPGQLRALHVLRLSGGARTCAGGGRPTSPHRRLQALRERGVVDDGDLRQRPLPAGPGRLDQADAG